MRRTTQRHADTGRCRRFIWKRRRNPRERPLVGVLRRQTRQIGSSPPNQASTSKSYDSWDRPAALPSCFAKLFRNPCGVREGERSHCHQDAILSPVTFDLPLLGIRRLSDDGLEQRGWHPILRFKTVVVLRAPMLGAGSGHALSDSACASSSFHRVRTLILKRLRPRNATAPGHHACKSAELC